MGSRKIWFPEWNIEIIGRKNKGDHIAIALEKISEWTTDDTVFFIKLTYFHQTCLILFGLKNFIISIDIT